MKDALMQQKPKAGVRVVSVLLFCFVLAGQAVAVGESPTSSQSGGGGGDGGGDPSDTVLTELKKYFKNLGEYLGYKIDKPPTDPISSTSLEDKESTTAGSDSIKNFVQSEQKLVESLLGTMPIHVLKDSTTESATTPPNSLLNAVFQQYAIYGQGLTQGTSTTTTGFIVSPQVDLQMDMGGQSPTPSSSATASYYLPDPVSQLIANMLYTPSSAYCTTYGSLANSQNGMTAFQDNCLKRYAEAIGFQVFGDIPNPTNVHVFDMNVIKQLNSNTMLGPLIYSSTPVTPSNLKGITGAATSQAQEAENFIRYVSGSFQLNGFMDPATLQSLYSDATSNPATSSTISSMAQLTSYFLQLRTGAAQMSVAVGNLYYLASKRIPQTPGVPSGTKPPAGTEPTSEALNEYHMATRRLYRPGKSGDAKEASQWIDKINKASSVTVQKEIAILLAEMNYQLYLSRQTQERELLTGSVMLLELGKGMTGGSVAPANADGANKGKTQ